ELLMHETLLPLGLGHRRKRLLVRDAGGVFVAEEFHIAAERNGGNLPARAVAIIEAPKFGTKADGEDQYPDTEPARDQEVAQLVEKHHQLEHDQKRDAVSQHAPAEERVDLR